MTSCRPCGPGGEEPDQYIMINDLQPPLGAERGGAGTSSVSRLGADLADSQVL